MFKALIGFCIFAAAPSLFGTTLRFDDAPFPAGSRQENSYSQDGFHLSGQFSHTGGSNSGRPENGTAGFISVLNGGHVQVIRSAGPFFEVDTNTGEQVPVEPKKLPFDAVSVDLAEYSVFFAFPSDVTFFGLTTAGRQLSHTFTTDGVMDSLGGLNDFEPFRFPSNFRNLISLTTHTPQAGNPNLPGFAFDNFQLLSVPEPTTVQLMLAVFGLLFGRYIRPIRN